jgi:hypothetical protein
MLLKEISNESPIMVNIIPECRIIPSLGFHHIQRLGPNYIHKIMHLIVFINPIIPLPHQTFKNLMLINHGMGIMVES